MLVETYTTLAQIQAEGFNEVAEQSTTNAILVTIIIILFGAIILFLRRNGKLNNKIVALTTKNAEQIKTQSDAHKDELLKKQNEYQKALVAEKDLMLKKLEEIRKEIFEKENERNKQWLESEKETLKVLNGVTRVLEMSEKMGKTETDKIITSIKGLEDKLNAIKNG